MICSSKTLLFKVLISSIKRELLLFCFAAWREREREKKKEKEREGETCRFWFRLVLVPVVHQIFDHLVSLRINNCNNKSKWRMKKIKIKSTVCPKSKLLYEMDKDFLDKQYYNKFFAVNFETRSMFGHLCLFSIQSRGKQYLHSENCELSY